MSDDLERALAAEARLAQIIDLASVYRDQVGTGPLLTNIRNGFQTIIDIGRGTDRSDLRKPGPK